MEIEIDIDTLRLEGVEGIERDELARLIQAHLQRLIDTYGVPPALRDGGGLQIPGRTIRVTAEASREQIGMQVAQGIAGDWYRTV